jgi:hypothetical protein
MLISLERFYSYLHVRRNCVQYAVTSECRLYGNAMIPRGFESETIVQYNVLLE